MEKRRYFLCIAFVLHLTKRNSKCSYESIILRPENKTNKSYERQCLPCVSPWNVRTHSKHDVYTTIAIFIGVRNSRKRISTPPIMVFLRLSYKDRVLFCFPKEMTSRHFWGNKIYGIIKIIPSTPLSAKVHKSVVL